MVSSCHIRELIDRRTNRGIAMQTTDAPGCSITGAQRGDELSITLVGEVDAASAPRITEFVKLEAQICPRRLVIELSAVTFVDSCGLALLVRAHRWVAGSGGQVVVRNANDQFLRLLDITGIDDLVTVEQGDPAAR